MKNFIVTLCCIFVVGTGYAQREKILMNNDWTFHLGNASSMLKDFTSGTEYFTYYSKAIGQNQGPASTEFNDSAWEHVNLPFDWVVDLPFSSGASHSHGYKEVGWKYPENSVGWYRHHFSIPKSDEGKAVSIQLDGVFRNAQVFCNGFYLGHEISGYATQTYNLSEYLNYGGDNIITVRCDASTEEGWYYEGGGIYRDVWLVKHDADHYIKDVFAVYDHDSLNVQVEATDAYSNTLYDKDGKVVAKGKNILLPLHPHLWTPDDPYLYTLRTSLEDDKDEMETKIGLRTFIYDVHKGLLLNGIPIKLKGADLHLDHAGVGVGVPDELWIYKVKKLKEMGMNSIRCSHNPATPAMLDVCDSLGMLVIDENRLMGTNKEHLDLLRRMIERDRNHPSVFLWSIGNEEWWIESQVKGEKIARTMIDFARKYDPSRKFTYANSGGFGLTKQVDIHGYNYIVQNDVNHRHQLYPDWFVVGTEETSGCGTRNVYVTDSTKGWMESINMNGEKLSHSEKNVIERGWKFYRDNTYAGGLFYWTGFDYRGEPNPMKWPATGSQFGILDYCGFPKDEAYYLKAAWTEKPVLHIFPHWNLKGMEGKKVEVWAYSNADEVELFQDGKSLGRKMMPKDGHLVWNTIYHPGVLRAVGYKDGKKWVTISSETTGAAVQAKFVASKNTLRSDGQDIIVVDITLQDSHGRYVPDACEDLKLAVTGNAELLGWGNGDPGFKAVERPQGKDKQHGEVVSFMGNAQVILRGVNSTTKKQIVVFSVTLPNGKTSILKIK